MNTASSSAESRTLALPLRSRRALSTLSGAMGHLHFLFASPITGFSTLFLLLITFACFLGEFIYPVPWDAVEFVFEAQAPSLSHPFGTDDMGRDLLARVLFGGKISLTVGLVTSLFAGVLGVLIGASAGFFGGWLDMTVTTLIDFLYSLPYYFIIILIMVFFNVNSIFTLFIILALFKWLSMARITRAQVLSMKESEFVLSLRAMGFSKFRILFLHMIPGCFGMASVYITLMIPGVMMQEAFLSFIGLTFHASGTDGIPKPIASWGTLLSEGSKIYETAPWLLAWPGLIFALTLLCINFLGDALRDRFDPNSGAENL